MKYLIIDQNNHIHNNMLKLRRANGRIKSLLHLHLKQEFQWKSLIDLCMNEVLSGPTGEIAIARNGWNAGSLVDS
jgi:hypothetical protein